MSRNSQYKNLSTASTTKNVSKYHGADDTEQAVLQILLHRNNDSHEFDETQSKRLNHFLVEFCTRYVYARTKKEVAPSPTLAYIRSIQGRLKEFSFSVNLFKSAAFDNSDNGIYNVLNKKFSLQKYKGQLTKIAQRVDNRRRKMNF